MSKINQFLDVSRKLSNEIKREFRSLGYKDEEDFQDMSLDATSSEEMLLCSELRKVFEKLEDINAIVEYLSLPIKYEGTLHKNEGGRYELENGYEFTSGSRIEALVFDDFYEKEEWVKTSVESNEKGYYLVGHRNVQMEGIKARVRE